MQRSAQNRYQRVPVTSTLSSATPVSVVDAVGLQSTLPSLSSVECKKIVSTRTNTGTDQSAAMSDPCVSMPYVQQLQCEDSSQNASDGIVSISNQAPVVPLLVEQPSMVSIAANIVSTLFLRIASRISFVLLGFYLGEHFASAMAVALVLESFYVSELLLAPMVGTLSDRFGRKPFLLLAPLLGAFAASCLLVAAQLYPHPDGAHFDLRLLGLLGLILAGRLLEGATTALNTPTSLGYITDVTTGSGRLRTQVMTAFEVATVGGLVLATPLGGKVSALMGTWGFVIVIGLHLANALLIFFFIVESQKRVAREKQRGSLLESLSLLRDKRIFTFLPAWLSINTLVGAWITLIVITLTYPKTLAAIRHPGQLFYGGFSKEFATQLLGEFGLLFLLGMGLWLLVIGRLRRTTVMLIGLVGLALCISSLSIMNGLAPTLGSLSRADHTTVSALLPFLITGVLLLSGFTPASLTQMSVLAEMKAGKRGTVMGLYSVVLGVGQLLGAMVGGFSVDLGGFTGLMVFSVILGLLSLGSVVYMRMHRDDLIEIVTMKAASG